MSDSIKYVLPEEAIPKCWYNIMADLPGPPPPVLHPGTGQPIGPDDLSAMFPPGVDRSGDERRNARLRFRTEVRRSVSAMATHSAVPRTPPGEGAGYARPHLLQVRRRESRRFA